MVIGAVFHVIHAFQVRRWSGFFFWLLGGVLYGVAGVLTLYNPLLAAAVLTLFLAVALIVTGIGRVWLSMRIRPQSGWGWITASGVVTILAGIVFAMHWPANTLFLLGIVLAVDLTFQGVAAIAFGLVMKGNRTLGAGIIEATFVRGELSASQVALEAGFAHQSHMARCMRRVLGRTPTAVARDA